MIEKIKNKINKRYENNKNKIKELNYKIKICNKNTRYSRLNRFAITNILTFCVCPFISFFAATTPFISIPTFYIGTIILHFISEKILNYKGKLNKFSSAKEDYEIEEEKNKFLLEKLNLEVDNNVNKKILDNIDNKKIDMNINKNNVEYEYNHNKEKLNNFYETTNERNKDFIYNLYKDQKQSIGNDQLQQGSIYTIIFYGITYPIAVLVGVTKGIIPFLLTEEVVAGLTFALSKKADDKDEFVDNDIKREFVSRDGKGINPVIDNNLIKEAVENKIRLETMEILKKEEQIRQEKKNISNISYYNYNEHVNSKPKTLVKSLYKK